MEKYEFNRDPLDWDFGRLSYYSILCGMQHWPASAGPLYQSLSSDIVKHDLSVIQEKTKQLLRLLPDHFEFLSKHLKPAQVKLY